MRSAIVLMSGIAFILQTGCADPGGHRIRGTPLYRITGSLVKPPGCPNYAHVKGSDVEVGGETLKRTFKPYQLIETRNILRFEVVALPTHFDAILGPLFGSPEPAKAYIKNSFVRVYIDCGWIYVNGSEANVETEYGSAGAEGSKFVVEIIKTGAGEKHRFYFLGGTRGWVKPKATRVATYLTTLETFVDMAADGTVTAPSPIAADAEANGFISEVKAIAAAAGI